MDVLHCTMGATYSRNTKKCGTFVSAQRRGLAIWFKTLDEFKHNFLFAEIPGAVCSLKPKILIDKFHLAENGLKDIRGKECGRSEG